jgi:hypothetical protein
MSDLEFKRQSRSVTVSPTSYQGYQWCREQLRGNPNSGGVYTVENTQMGDLYQAALRAGLDVSNRLEA